MGLVLFLAAIEATEPFVMVEAYLVQTDILIVHTSVVLAIAGYLCEPCHIFQRLNKYILGFIRGERS